MEKLIFMDVDGTLVDYENNLPTSAITALLQHLNVNQSDTIAMGDALIDIPMFEACAFSVCMCSGRPEAKAAANYVTDDVDKNGLYNAFAHIGLL